MHMHLEPFCHLYLRQYMYLFLLMCTGVKAVITYIFSVCFGFCIHFRINLDYAYIFGFVLDFEYTFRIDILHIRDFFDFA